MKDAFSNVPHRPPVPSNRYDAEYYRDCEGWEEFRRGALSRRLAESLRRRFRVRVEPRFERTGSWRNLVYYIVARLYPMSLLPGLRDLFTDEIWAVGWKKVGRVAYPRTSDGCALGSL